MNDATQKAIFTRHIRIAERFEATHGRRPTIDEVKQAYTDEMKAMQRKSAQARKEKGIKTGFGALKQQGRITEMKAAQDKGRKVRWSREKTDNPPTEEESR